MAARARPCAARTRLFELIATPIGALRAPPHRSFAASYSTPQKYIKSIELGPPTSRAFFFPQRLWNKRSPAPAPPIAASLILPAIFLGSNYVFYILTVCCMIDMHINVMHISVILRGFSRGPSLFWSIWGQNYKYNVPPPISQLRWSLWRYEWYIEKTPRKFQFGKKSAKVYHCLYSSTEQLQVALWTYIFLTLGF